MRDSARRRGWIGAGLRSMRVLLGAAIMSVSLLGGCASLPTEPRGGVSPLVYDPQALERATMIVIALPGVLNSVVMYDPAEAWAADGVALARYRFPAMDGLALDHRITVESVIATISDLLEQHPEKRVGLLGYSAGGQLALEAAQALAAYAPRVVVMATAQGFPETLYTSLRGARAVVAIAIGDGTTELPQIWRRYYPILLYGHDGAADPARQADIARIVAQQQARIVYPNRALLSAQAGDLAWRRLRISPELAATPILLLHGDADPSASFAAAERLAAQLPNARLETVAGGGHLIYLTHPEVFDAARAFFLEETAASRVAGVQ